MDNKKPVVDLKVMDNLYRLTRLAINTDDDESRKQGLIEVAEDEADDILAEAHEVLERAFGDEWRELIGVLTAVLTGVSLEKSEDETGLDFIGALDDEQSKSFYLTLRITSQVSFVGGFAMALKAAGVWEKFKAELGDKDG